VTQNKSKLENKRNIKIVIVAAIVVLSLVTLVRFYEDIFGPPSPYLGVDESGSAHEHAKFKVYINGRVVDLNPKQNSSYKKGNEYIFLEDDGNTIHRFAKGAPMGLFFEGLGMKFDRNCIVLDDTKNNGRFDERSNCVDGDKKILFYVNNEPNDHYDEYVIQDGDRILIAYGEYDQRDITIMLGTISSLPFFG